MISATVVLWGLFGTSNVAAQVCNISTDGLSVNWDTLFTNGTESVFDSISMTQTQGSDSNGVITVTLTVVSDFKVVSEYALLADQQYGFTYVLDSYMFEDTGRLLAEANPCENRLASSFNNLSIYSEYWTYSLDPSKVGNHSNGMQYPNPNIWTIDANCDTVTWQHEFTFDELRNDCGFVWSDAGDTFELKGEFYLTAVSPNPILYASVASGSDNGDYVTRSLVSQELTLSFQKSITIVSDANVDLFGAYTLSADYDEDLALFEITVLTYVPNYMALDDAGANKQIQVSADATGASATCSLSEDASYAASRDCLLNDDYRCWQKFIITIDLDECPDATVVSISGDYTILTEFECIGSQDACDEYYDAANTDAESSIITLDSISLSYLEDCDDHTKYDVSFTGTLGFYTDDTFTTLKTDSFESNGETVFARVALDAIEGYSVLGLTITGITLCTADVADDTVITSCLDSDVDASLFYDVISDSTTSYSLLSTDTLDSEETFSFTLPVLADGRFFVDCSVEITLNNGRRRLSARTMLQDDGVTALSNFVGTASITSSVSDTVVVTDDKTDGTDGTDGTDATDGSTDGGASGDDEDTSGGNVVVQSGNDEGTDTVALVLSIMGGCLIIGLSIGGAIVYSVRSVTKPRQTKISVEDMVNYVQARSRTASFANSGNATVANSVGNSARNSRANSVHAMMPPVMVPPQGAHAPIQAPETLVESRSLRSLGVESNLGSEIVIDYGMRSTGM